MKRILCLLVALLMLAATVACNSSSDDDRPAKKEEVSKETVSNFTDIFNNESIEYSLGDDFGDFSVVTDPSDSDSGFSVVLKPTFTLTLSTGEITPDRFFGILSGSYARYELYLISEEDGETKEYLCANSDIIDPGDKLSVMNVSYEYRHIFRRGGTYYVKYKSYLVDPDSGNSLLLDESESLRLIVKD